MRPNCGGGGCLFTTKWRKFPRNKRYLDLAMITATWYVTGNHNTQVSSVAIFVM